MQKNYRSLFQENFGGRAKMAFFRVIQKEKTTTIICRTLPLDKIDTMRMDILERSEMQGLFRIKKAEKNKYIYSAPRSFPIKDYLLLHLTEQDFYRMALQILEIVRGVEEQGLLRKNLIFDLEHVFIEPQKSEVFLIYNPTVNGGKEKKVLELVADIIQYYNKKHSKERPLCLEMVALLKSGNFSEIMMENHIRIKCPQLFEKKRYTQLQIDEFTGPQQVVPAIQKRQMQHTGQKNEAQSMLLGTTLLVEEDDFNEATTLLCQTQDNEVPQIKTIRLNRLKTGEVYLISQKEFSIGKGMGNDLVIADNKTVSRRHAVIKRTPDGYKIVDFDSLNHTYMNGKMLVAGQEESISNGDIIRFSDEEFKVEE